MDISIRWKQLTGAALLALALAACGGSEAQDEAAIVDDGPNVAAADRSPAETVPGEMPATNTPEPPTATSTEATSQETVAQETAEGATAPTPPDETVEEPASATEDGPAFNGAYEQTFFRGSATAPVTMFDYSDFL